MNLYSKRKEAGLTQATVAQALNVTVSAIPQWESGATKPRIEYLTTLAELYGCTIEELLETE